MCSCFCESIKLHILACLRGACFAVASTAAGSRADMLRRHPTRLPMRISCDAQAQPAAGGADVEIGGSVPGTVRHTPGGVARNIAVGLALRCRWVTAGCKRNLGFRV